MKQNSISLIFYLPLTFSLTFLRYGPSPQLRGHEESRDWLRSHSTSGLQDSANNSPFSPSLTSPSGTRFNFGQLGMPHTLTPSVHIQLFTPCELGYMTIKLAFWQVRNFLNVHSLHLFTASSPTSTGQMNLTGLRNNSLTNQDVPFDPCSDSRLRNSCMSLDEKTRTMSRSGSFRDGFEEGEKIFHLHHLLFFFLLFHTRRANRVIIPCVWRTLGGITSAPERKALHPFKNP